MTQEAAEGEDWKAWRRIDSGVAQPPPAAPTPRVRVSSRRRLAARHAPPHPFACVPAAWLPRATRSILLRSKRLGYRFGGGEELGADGTWGVGNWGSGEDGFANSKRKNIQHIPHPRGQPTHQQAYPKKHPATRQTAFFRPQHKLLGKISAA